MRHFFIRLWEKTRLNKLFFGANKEKGYALPTVLLISMIIIVISAQITFSVRQKIETAIELKARNMAYLKSHSAMSEVIYSILTSTFTGTGLRIFQEDGSQTIWNLYGEPIKLSQGVTVRLRDTSGMLSPFSYQVHLRKLMEYVSKDSTKNNLFLDALADWQDPDDLKRLNGAESFDYRMAGYGYGPRNYFVQVPHELMLLKGFDQAVFDKIREDLVYWSSGTINYLTMSETLLRAMLGNDPLADRIIQLRKEGNLTGKIFRDLTGTPIIEMGDFWPSGWIKVEIRAEVEKAVDNIEAVILKRQFTGKPFMITEWRR